MTNRSDAEVVASHLAGDRDAFNELYRRYYKLVFKTALRMTRDIEMAREIAQDVFLNIHKFLHGWKPELGLPSWITTATWRRTEEVMEELWNRWDTSIRINTVGVDRTRAGRKRQFADPQMDIFADLERREFWDLIGKMVKELPKHEQQPFILHDIEGLKSPEIGRRLGISAAAVNSRVQRARQRAREFLGDKFAA